MLSFLEKLFVGFLCSWNLSAQFLKSENIWVLVSYKAVSYKKKMCITVLSLFSLYKGLIHYSKPIKPIMVDSITAHILVMLIYWANKTLQVLEYSGTFDLVVSRQTYEQMPRRARVLMALLPNCNKMRAQLRL